MGKGKEAKKKNVEMKNGGNLLESSVLGGCLRRAGEVEASIVDIEVSWWEKRF